MKKIIKDWMGTEFTRDLVLNNIRARWGKNEADNCDLQKDCFTLTRWNGMGYRVLKGEKAIQTFVVEVETDTDGQPISAEPRRVSLFYKLQVEKA